MLRSILINLGNALCDEDLLAPPESYIVAKCTNGIGEHGLLQYKMRKNS